MEAEYAVETILDQTQLDKNGFFRFEPGSDETHYCKPTSVAVTDDGNTFFVSDGYCNSRVIKYKVGSLQIAKLDQNTWQVTVEQGSGRHQVQKVTEWGRGAGPFTLKPAAYNFNIPHGLALAEDKNEVFVCHLPSGLTPFCLQRCVWRIERMDECSALTWTESSLRL